MNTWTQLKGMYYHDTLCSNTRTTRKIPEHFYRITLLFLPAYIHSRLSRQNKRTGEDAMRKPHVTPAATDFHWDLDVHQNTASVTRGARVQPLRKAQCITAGTRWDKGVQT